MMARIVTATEEHIERFLPHLRPIDAAEIRVIGGCSPEHAIRRSVERSEPHAYAALDDEDHVLALFGFGSPSPIGRVGVPWLLGSVRLQEHKRDLLQLSRTILAVMRNGSFDMMVNVVWAENRASIRYLEALGFTVEPEVAIPGSKTAVRPFWWMKG